MLLLCIKPALGMIPPIAGYQDRKEKDVIFSAGKAACAGPTI